MLVDNAGAGAAMTLAETTLEHLNGVFAVNMVAPTLLAASAAPHLSRTRGAIVNIPGSLAQKAVASFGAYCGSKAALEQMTRCWALELASRGVRVNAVASGPVESDFLRDRMGLSEAIVEAVKEQERSIIPVGRRGVPDDVARGLCRSPAKSQSG